MSAPSVIVRKRKVRDVVRLHQHWQHMRTRQAIYVTQIFRHERRVLAALWEPTVAFPSNNSRLEYVSFAELEKNYTLMAPYPRRSG